MGPSEQGNVVGAPKGNFAAQYTAGMNTALTLTRHPYEYNVIVKGRGEELSLPCTGLVHHDLSQQAPRLSQFVAMVTQNQWEPGGHRRAAITRYMLSLMSTLLPDFHHNLLLIGLSLSDNKRPKT